MSAKEYEEKKTNNDLVIGMELFHLTTCFINKVWRVCLRCFPCHFSAGAGARVPVLFFVVFFC